MLKICRYCHKEKPITEFYKRACSPDKHHYYCKECARKLTKLDANKHVDRIKKYKNEHYKRNISKCLEYAKNYREKNKNVIRAKNKLYYQKNKERRLKYTKAHYTNNKQYYSKINKKYRESHKEQITANKKAYYIKNKAIINLKREQNREAENVRMRKYRKSNPEKFSYPEYKLRVSIRRRIRNALGGSPKKYSAQKELGCTILELKQYIESKFYPNPETGEMMTWENRSMWHLDHIKPLSLFNLSDYDQFKQACHYTNLQPLWAKENIKKGNRYIG